MRECKDWEGEAAFHFQVISVTPLASQCCLVILLKLVQSGYLLVCYLSVLSSPITGQDWTFGTTGDREGLLHWLCWSSVQCQKRKKAFYVFFSSAQRWADWWVWLWSSFAGQLCTIPAAPMTQVIGDALCSWCSAPCGTLQAFQTWI